MPCVDVGPSVTFCAALSWLRAAERLWLRWAARCARAVCCTMPAGCMEIPCVESRIGAEQLLTADDVDVLDESQSCKVHASFQPWQYKIKLDMSRNNTYLLGAIHIFTPSSTHPIIVCESSKVLNDNTL